MEIDKEAREIQSLAEQKGERVPSKREARAMGRLVESAESAARHVRRVDSYDVLEEAQFMIISTTEAGKYAARLCVEGKKKVIATGTCQTHFMAVEDLLEEVGPREDAREIE
ncbi:hypothetical protein HBI23_199430 [Parastagonospora nodorum]|nr:hypothetical protein HBI47_127540 [Parastagonospora nodorum]KAH5641453.1 hypothetical protein HBI23_199430 [Parastagonospora nodorum]